MQNSSLYLLKRRLLVLLTVLLTSIFLQQVQAQYTLNGSATQNNCHCYTLTRAVNTQQGSVWNNNRINLTQSFDFKFNVNLGCVTNGADGIVFVLQNQNTSIGGNGSGMGYGGISPGVGVTLDTYQNISPDNDPAYDHISIQLNGDVNHAHLNNNIAGPVPISSVSNNVKDCQWHVLRIVWDAVAHSMTTYFDGVLRLSVVNDFTVNVFSGNPSVFWGFTGATGGLNNLQQFCTSLTPNFHTQANQSRCQNQPVPFFDSTTSFGPIISRKWDFGDGSPIDSVNVNPVHTYATGGDFIVTLTVTSIDGCTEVSTQTVHVGSKPVANFTPNDGCQDTTIAFTDVSTVLNGSVNTWYWSLGDGTTSTLQNPSNTYTSTGSKIIKLAVNSADGCLSDTAVQTITIYPNPTANFGFTNNVCSGGQVTFHDSSLVSSGSITSWNWDLADGQTDTLRNPVGTYLTPGTKQIILIATSDKGCRSAPVTKVLNVLAKPVAAFTPHAVCQYSSVVFSDSSYSFGGGTINSWWWNLGNGVTSTSQNPSTTYLTAGQIVIALVVHSTTGCTSDTLFQTFFVNAKPVANFSANNTCQDSTVSFIDSSTTQNGSINSWYWDLGNGVTSVQPSPSTTYSSYGNKIVKLTVSSLAGCSSDTVIKIIQIYPKAIANFYFNNNICSGGSVVFHDSSYTTAGSITGWSWNLGDGQTSSLPDPQGNYLTGGVRNITLISTTNKGCRSAPLVKQLTVVGKPIAYFTHGAICQSSPTQFFDSSYSTDGSSITQRWWDLGNGQNSTSSNPITIYNTGGIAIVQLAVKSLGGCLSDTLRDTLFVNPKPFAGILYSNPLCSGVPVQFSDSVPGSATYLWNFDGVDNTVSNPVQTFSSGNHTIKLIATSAAGCSSDTAAQIIIINASPLIGMNFQNSCNNSPVLFTAIDSMGNTNNIWSWSFGDGSIGSGAIYNHTYHSVGNYNIKLSAVSQQGCASAQIQKVINIYGTNASAGPDRIAAALQPIQLNAIGGVSYQWSPAYGLNDPNIANPVAILDRNQTYYLKAFTPQGCASYDTINIKIYKGPDIYVPNAFSPNNDGHNDLFQAVPIGIVTFYYLKVYNRWGQVIYNSSDYTKGWDGKFKGDIQPVGAYIWIASGLDFKNQVITRKGTVMLLR